MTRNKHLKLEQSKIDRAKKLLGARTEQETIERALDAVLGEERPAVPPMRAVPRVATSLDKLRAHFGEWTGPVPTYEEMKDARRDLWKGHVEEASKRER